MKKGYFRDYQSMQVIHLLQSRTGCVVGAVSSAMVYGLFFMVAERLAAGACLVLSCLVVQ